MSLLNRISLPAKKSKLVLENIHRKKKLNPPLGLKLRNPFLLILCIESGNKNGGTMSHTDNLNYLKISKPNIQDGYLTCIFRPKATRIINELF